MDLFFFLGLTKDLFFWVHNFYGFIFLGVRFCLVFIFWGITKNVWAEPQPYTSWSTTPGINVSLVQCCKIYMFWIRKCSAFLFNNQTITIDLQIDHPGSRQ